MARAEAIHLLTTNEKSSSGCQENPSNCREAFYTQPEAFPCLSLWRPGLPINALLMEERSLHARLVGLFWVLSFGLVLNQEAPKLAPKFGEYAFVCFLDSGIQL